MVVELKLLQVLRLAGAENEDPFNNTYEAKQLEKFNLPKFDDLKLWPIDPTEIYYTKYGFLALYLELS